MTIEIRGSSYIFRECDVRGMSCDQVKAEAEKHGRMQYEPNGAWLIVPGIGYGMRDDWAGCDMII